jgi:hypothetical protein
MGVLLHLPEQVRCLDLECSSQLHLRSSIQRLKQTHFRLDDPQGSIGCCLRSLGMLAERHWVQCRAFDLEMW